MLVVSSLNTINSLISKALSDDFISDEEYSLILLKFETFTRMKEDLREKSKVNIDETGNIETEDNELLRRNKIGVPTGIHVQNHIQTIFKTIFKTVFKLMFNIMFKTIFENYKLYQMNTCHF